MIRWCEMVTNLQHCHKMVHDFRFQADSFWPTPNTKDSLRYAFTEIAEAVDADLRARRKTDARNNDKESRVEEELADCAIMLLTALEEKEIEVMEVGEISLEEIALDMATAMYYGTKEGLTITWQPFANRVLNAINERINMEEEIDWKLDRIWRKHGK